MIDHSLAFAIAKNERLLQQRREWQALEAAVLQKKIRLQKCRNEFCVSVIVLAIATLTGFCVGVIVW